MDNLAKLLRGGLLCLPTWPLTASPSSAYPSRSVTVIVPFAAGGPTDKVAVIITGYLATTLGQQFVIENVVGGGGGTTAARGMRATPDRYTLTTGQMGTHRNAPAVILVMTNRQLPVETLPELLAYLRQHPNTKMVHAGAGSISYASCTLPASIVQLQSADIALRGSGPALRALPDGRIDDMCDQIVNSIDRVRTGELRALAISANARNPFLPDVPTAAEAGVPGFDMTAWHALFAPQNTPPELIDRLSAALSAALDDAAVRQQFTDLAGDIAVVEQRGRAALDDLIHAEVASWKPHLEQAPLSDGQRAWQ
ncbi:tripartite tricarboxylate transporter substrate-binding protein [Rhodopseudomonas infernalis]|uniref:tripartite tricarboxylate transporter substrate-binding protein n=1 Tax=Rhodopseudomonas infernalis TaxID=2897386 RepID=UPI001EE80B35|nr:tripartite tricarboxylate transporter substrate-binding protein [Rhodopseudomonas infernalis]